MRHQNRWPRRSWLPILGGLLWLLAGFDGGIAALVLALPVGVLLVSTGAGQLLWPGDLRITQTMGLAGAVGTLLFLPLVLATGLGTALILGLTAGACFLLSGATAIHQEPTFEDVPAPEHSLRLSACVAIDEVVLGLEQFNVGLPRGDFAVRLASETEAAQSMFEERGYLAAPASYHEAPPPLERPNLVTRHTGRIAYEHVSFESEYAPRIDEPGRDRWLSRGPNRTAHAYLLRHRDGPRPWLVCNAGYRMGHARVDLRIFRELHEKHGLNVAVPVFPLHGPRRIGRMSGEGFLSFDVLDTVHAAAQTVWDVRRLIGWLRAEGAGAVGVMGYSLGGFGLSLTACFEEGLACAIAGIPLTDLARMYWRHGPSLQLAYLTHVHVDPDDIESLLRVVNPLVLEPLPPREVRTIFGGVADRLVPPDQVRDLARHWNPARMVWSQGSHITTPLDPAVIAAVQGTLRDAKLIV